jgi:hypothetical protein
MRFTIRILTFVFITGLASLSSSQTGWFPLNTLISNTIIGVHFINADTGFVWTQWEGNWRTSNGGLTWQPLNANGREMLFVDNNRIGYFYQRLGVYQTTDHGVTWEFRDDIGDQDIEFPTPKVGYSIVLGLGDDRDSNGVLFGKSIDSGKTWAHKYVRIGETPYRFEGDRIFFQDENYGYLIYRLYIYPDRPKEFLLGAYYTSDGGETWHFPLKGPPVEIFDVIHLYERTWLYSGLSGAILRTDNDFITEDQVSLNTVPSKVTYCFPEGKLSKASTAHIYSFDHKGVYYSPDSGTTWYRQFCQGYTGGQWGYGISMGSEQVGYFVGLDSQVYKTIDGGGAPLTVINLNSCNCELTASPNPANTYLEIAIDRLNSDGLIEVYDALGRRVAQELVAPHETSHRLDIRSYPAGVYYVRVGSKQVHFIKQ